MSPTTPETDVPQLMRVRRCASLLDRSVSGTYDLIRRGELPAIKVGGSVRVASAALMTYIADHAVPARVEAGDETCRKAVAR